MEEDNLKIAVLGLQNAGKTSLIKSLKQEFSLLSDSSPTKGVGRRFIEIFGQNISFWDFGGQEIYRNRYLESEDKYFSKIHTVFYVLDVQDHDLILDSIEYFNKVMTSINKLNEKVQLIFLFHKWDPSLNDEEEIKRYTDAKSLFLDNVLENIPEDIPFKLFETTIFDPLSIVKAFSKPLFSRKDLYKRTTDILKMIVKKYNLIFSIVSLKDFIELGSYFSVNYAGNLKEGILGFFELAKKQIEFTPYFMLDCKSFMLSSIKFKIENKDGVFPAYLVIGYEDSTRDDIEMLLLALKDEILKLFDSIGMKYYKI